MKAYIEKIGKPIFFLLPTDRLHQNGLAQIRHATDQTTIALGIF